MLNKPTPIEDEWSRDPQVCHLRRIFGRIESAQNLFLEKLQITPWDERLRDIRKKALILFESAWAESNPKGVSINEEEFEVLYLLCLARLCRSRGIEIPQETLPNNIKLENLLKEIKF
jgi:hypothetical protein